MALIKPEKLAAWLKEQQAQKSLPQAAFIFGEPYLTRRALATFEAALLAEGGTLHAIDGDEEDVQDTMNKLATFSLFGGRQVFRVTDSQLLAKKVKLEELWKKVNSAHAASQETQTRKALSAFLRAGGLEPEEGALSGLSAAEWKKAFEFTRPSEDLAWTDPVLRQLSAKKSGKKDDTMADQVAALLEKGLPSANFLLLQMDGEADKRKKLFKFLEAKACVVDCTVAEGANRKARDEQEGVVRRVMAETLAALGKRLGPGAEPVFLERVGFSPAAVQNELEKLALFVGENPEITRADLDLMLGRTRQEAIFELTGAVTDGKLGDALFILDRLLAGGTHYLAIMASLRGHVHKMLLFHLLVATGEIPMTPATRLEEFQRLLATAKEGRFKAELGGKVNPMALFYQFKEASRQSLPRLLSWTRPLLNAERRLKRKGGVSSEALILHRLIVEMLIPPGRAASSTLAKSTARITIQR